MTEELKPLTIEELARRIESGELDGVRGLRWARLRKGMTQKALAQMVGVYNRTLCAWEQGRQWPSAYILPALATALDVSIEELYLGGYE